MKQKTIVIVIFLATAFVLIIACCVGVFIYGLMADPNYSLSNTVEQLGALPELQSKLSDEFPSQSITVEITNGHIVETNLFNAEYLNLPNEAARQKKAKEIAVFITKNYRTIDTIDTISITFTERISVGINMDKYLSYVFYVNDLK